MPTQILLRTKYLSNISDGFIKAEISHSAPFMHFNLIYLQAESLSHGKLS